MRYLLKIKLNAKNLWWTESQHLKIKTGSAECIEQKRNKQTCLQLHLPLVSSGPCLTLWHLWLLHRLPIRAEKCLDARRVSCAFRSGIRTWVSGVATTTLTSELANQGDAELENSILGCALKRESRGGAPRSIYFVQHFVPFPCSSLPPLCDCQRIRAAPCFE